MLKPTFLIIGAGKCGTTSLWDLLRQHPEICMCDPKEPNFFGSDENYAKGWEWYGSFFEKSSRAKAVGDVSPQYASLARYPAAPGRIGKDLPQAGLIYIVRHPLDRIVSSYLQALHTRHNMPRNFSKSVREYVYHIDITRYWSCISEYRKYFADSSIKILFFEDFKSNPRKVIEEICSFIGVDSSFEYEGIEIPRNPSEGHLVDSLTLHYLRKMPRINYLKHLLPDVVSRRLIGGMQVPAKKDIKWDSETKRWVLNQIRQEAEATLNYAGKPLHFWDL